MISTCCLSAVIPVVLTNEVEAVFIQQTETVDSVHHRWMAGYADIHVSFFWPDTQTDSICGPSVNTFSAEGRFH